MSSHSQKADRLQRLFAATDDALWIAHARSLGSSAPAGLRFPSQKPPAPTPLRVSEQEARHLFCSVAAEHGYSYNLETPTERKYKQSGANATRARFDASLLDETGTRSWNVEFKHGGISPASSSKAVYKDIEKLLVDPGDGAWFHLLERIDNKTINKLIGRIRADVATVVGNHRIDTSAALVLHVCVLRPAISIHRVITIGELLDPATDLLFPHHVAKSQVTWTPSAWHVHEHNEVPKPKQPNWDTHRLSLWDMVNDRQPRTPLPATPPETLEEATAWYGPITPLLCHSFGWPRPDLGLLRWYEAGRPSWDRRFEILNEVWGEHLDTYLAWAATSTFAVDAWNDLQATCRLDPAPSAAVPGWLDANWIEQAARRAGPHNPAPLGGGDPLHLSTHIEEEGHSFEPQLFGVDSGAVLTAGRGWYRHLHRETELDDPRTVDVIDPHSGRLGLYRRSTTTGRWFSGAEEHHLLGAE